ncbi:hypothetical protein [Chitinophaga sp.]|uniref:hypothetical protein n=1 Tax=Chitinophaga sp. TaxID=1869181 RepID=UPI0031E3C5E5
MCTILYDKDGNELEYHNLQDKLHWCREGESKEQAFVRRYVSLGYKMNPEKESNEYAPDLISTTNVLTDLKSQHSPFFKAGERYGIDPNFAVVFNVKDKVRYKKEYPDIDILYYVDWIAVRANIYGKSYEVQPLIGVYRISFQDFLPILDGAPVHEYIQRKGDLRGNAKDSYVLDIRDPAFERLH